MPDALRGASFSCLSKSVMKIKIHVLKEAELRVSHTYQTLLLLQKPQKALVQLHTAVIQPEILYKNTYVPFNVHMLKAEVF